MPAPLASPCLCSFDVDRTLTGKQGDLQECEQNQVLPSVGDSAYGGGNLTLSPLGQSIGDTFCAACYVAIVTAGDASGFESDERAVLVERLGSHGKLASTSWTGPSLLAEARTNCSKNTKIHKHKIINNRQTTNKYNKCKQRPGPTAPGSPWTRPWWWAAPTARSTSPWRASWPGWRRGIIICYVYFHHNTF